MQSRLMPLSCVLVFFCLSAFANTPRFRRYSNYKEKNVHQARPSQSYMIWIPELILPDPKYCNAEDGSTPVFDAFDAYIDFAYLSRLPEDLPFEAILHCQSSDDAYNTVIKFTVFVGAYDRPQSQQALLDYFREFAQRSFYGLKYPYEFVNSIKGQLYVSVEEGDQIYSFDRSPIKIQDSSYFVLENRIINFISERVHGTVQEFHGLIRDVVTAPVLERYLSLDILRAPNMVYVGQTEKLDVQKTDGQWQEVDMYSWAMRRECDKYDCR